MECVVESSMTDELEPDGFVLTILFFVLGTAGSAVLD